MADRGASEWLAVLGHPAGLAWVLENRRLAFAPERAREVKRLKAGERVLIYAAKGAYKSSKATGGVIAAGVASSDVKPLTEPVKIERRDYTLSAALDLELLTPHGETVEVPPLLDQLKTFPTYGPRSWMTVLRKPLLRLQPGDADVLTEALRDISRPPDEELAGYLSV
jgi:hypothetical protein